MVDFLIEKDKAAFWGRYLTSYNKPEGMFFFNRTVTLIDMSCLHTDLENTEIPILGQTHGPYSPCPVSDNGQPQVVPSECL